MLRSDQTPGLLQSFNALGKLHHLLAEPKLQLRHRLPHLHAPGLHLSPKLGPHSVESGIELGLQEPHLLAQTSEHYYDYQYSEERQHCRHPQLELRIHFHLHFTRVWAYRKRRVAAMAVTTGQSSLRFAKAEPKLMEGPSRFDCQDQTAAASLWTRRFGSKETAG